MKASFKVPFEKTNKQVATFYCIGDDGVINDYFYRYLELGVPEESQEIKISIKQLSQFEFIQIYDFPNDKMLRTAIQLYFNILPNPDLILYFLKVDAFPRDIREWIKIINVTHSHCKIVFISDVTTYLQREKLISRVGSEFQFNILENICFSSLEPHSIERLMASIRGMGLGVSTAVCLKPTFREKMNQKLKGISCRVRKMINSIGKNKQYESTV